MAKPTKPGEKEKGGKKGKKSKMMHDAPAEETVNGVHPGHHEGDDDIHIHIHEAGENCANHDDHHGEHGEHHGYHGAHGGRGGHACAMCARALQHHGPDHDDHRQDHPGHHGPAFTRGRAAKHDHSEDYVYAHCAMGPNMGVPKKKRSKVTGAVHLRQLIYGGPVEMMIDLKGSNLTKV
ncbi:histidine-rich glycoprotein-like isoform X2 [Liolophura sinensis]|uniref:histidine-rich glycoprotein-like isoform X2 n=1 Tax=Liolophura sinensis TaxID=3198878 RepID=UPI003158B990